MPSQFPKKRRKQKGARIVDDDALQQKEHEEGIFGAIQRGDLNTVLAILAADRSQLDKRDSVGAAPIHAAFLYERYEIGKALVTQYVECALQEYTLDQYEGENILHIVIVNQDHAMAVWLLEQMPELVNSEAVGEFFKPTDDAYFGGYPLLFAVATNQEDMLDAILDTAYLKRSPACVPLKNSIFLRDRFGNTALHMAVIHELPQMYDHVLCIAEEHEKWLALEHDVPFRNWANNDNLTPLSLAAAMGKEEMFRHILNKHTKDAWKYGPVVCQMMPLLGLEQPTTVLDSDGELQRCSEILAMECICAGPYSALSSCIKFVGSKVPHHVEEGRLAIVAIPAVKQLLEKKWESFGHSIFIRKMVFVLVTQILWTISMVIPNHWRLQEGNLWAYPVENGVIIACEALVLLGMFWRFVNEIKEIVAKGVEYFTRSNGAAALDNGLGLSFCVFYTLLWVMRLCGLPVAEDIFASLAALVGWCYMFFFLLGFRSTGPFIIMIKEMIQFDMRRFGLVYAAVLLAFNSALYLVRYANSEPDVLTFFITMKEILLLAIVGDFDFDGWNDGTNAWLLNLLVIAYIIFVNILLLNLLIAMMGNTYSAINETAELRWSIERANIMSAFEGELSLEKMQECRKKYAVPLGAEPSRKRQGAITELYLRVMTKDQHWKDHTAVKQQEKRAQKADSRRKALPPSVRSDFEEREAQARAAIVESQEEWHGYIEQSVAMLAAHSLRHPAALADRYAALSPSIAALHR
eukprot:GGOE01005809.1.p1 GENE.GGOE01005809.1~~GGOE01005809.1.p1  ORF type:complete len:749 (+),score=290.08 GGOE01005809.1:42-2288(+)